MIYINIYVTGVFADIKGCHFTLIDGLCWCRLMEVEIVRVYLGGKIKLLR